MHMQGFMAFKYCSLDPVIFHLHCNVEQAKGYGNECDWPFNCLTYIKIEAFSCFLTYPAHLKENDRKRRQRLPSRSQSGFPVLCSRALQSSSGATNLPSVTWLAAQSLVMGPCAKCGPLLAHLVPAVLFPYCAACFFSSGTKLAPHFERSF